MKMFELNGDSRKMLTSLSFMRQKQAAAVMDCIGRMIPHEGVDYDVEIIFKTNDKLGINIDPHTDKGRWWRDYVMEMINKYPPQIKNPEPSLPEDPNDKAFSGEGEEEEDGK